MKCFSWKKRKKEKSPKRKKISFCILYHGWDGRERLFIDGYGWDECRNGKVV
jgi:hypothetical protein